MSREVGPATQNGVVVADLDAALAYWTGGLGVGPFYRIDNLENACFFQRGEELASPAMSIALGNWGDLQIELICPHGAGGSTWHRFLENSGGGLHHISTWSANYERDVARAFDIGRLEECRGQVKDGPRYTYFRSDIPGQPLLEISEILPQSAEIYRHIREEARNWDGRNAIRRLG